MAARIDEEHLESNVDDMSVLSDCDYEPVSYSIRPNGAAARFETDDEEEEEDNELSQAVVKKKEVAGRKPTWTDDVICDLVDIVCENEYLRKRIIFTNNKNMKNSEVYSKVLSSLEERCSSRGESCSFNVKQARSKFKSLVAICKKASLTRRTASGIEDLVQAHGCGKWFHQLLPHVQSTESAQPEQAIEPSASTTPTGINTSPEERSLYVPYRKRKRTEAESQDSALKQVVQSFNKMVEKDSTKELMEYFKHENEQARNHEQRMMEMQMNWQAQMMQMVMQQQQPINMQQRAFQMQQPPMPQQQMPYINSSTVAGNVNIDQQQSYYQLP